MDVISLSNVQLMHMETLANFWLNKIAAKNYFLAAALKGFRNGIVYGVRVRAPHAFVMMILFGQGTLFERLKHVIRMTQQHAWNLGRFVLGYKLMMGLLRQRINFIGTSIVSYKQWHPFVSAFLVAYFVFGKENGVNMQINLYLLSRIIYGLIKLTVERKIIPKPRFATFPLFAATVWGTVLWLFENNEQVLQKSLKSSMTYLYHDSNHWTKFRDFLLGAE